MVITMPGFAKRDERRSWQVMPLDGYTVDAPPLGSIAMRDVADQPMSRDADRNTHRYAPDQPR